MKGLKDETFHCKWYFTTSESQNKISFLKNCSKSILFSQISVSQGQTDIQAGNSGNNLYSTGSEEVQAVASTKHSKDKFNNAHFLCN